MEITKLGESCFKIKGKRAIVLINPSPELKNLSAHILLLYPQKKERGEFLLSSKKEIPKLKGEPVVIFGPGEYEIRQVRIFGTKEKEKTIYKIEMNGLSLLYLDGLEEKISEEKVELLSEVDILFLPVGRGKVAFSLVSQLEPLIVIPIKDEGLKDFLKGEGVGKVDRLSKFIITKEELPEERKIVILKSG